MKCSALRETNNCKPSWSPPDSPNAHRLTYSLFRDDSDIYTTEDQYPYSEFKDWGMERYNILGVDTLVKFSDMEDGCCGFLCLADLPC